MKFDNKTEALIINAEGDHAEESFEREEYSLQELLKQLERNYNRISFARLGAFLVFVAGLILVFTVKSWWTFLLPVAGGVAFCLLLIRHNSVSSHQHWVERRLQVLDYMKKRKNGNWCELSETGDEFLKKDNYVAKDLDLFGTHSLYQMICTAHTSAGKRRLAEVLLQAERAEAEVQSLTDRQQAVRELQEHRNFRVVFETLALEQENEASTGAERKEADSLQTGAERKEADSLQAGTEHTEADEPQEENGGKKGFAVLSVLAYIWPVFLLLSLLGGILHWWNSGAILIVYFAGLLLSWLTAGYCQEYTTGIFANRTVLQSNLYLMEAVAQESFSADLLVKIQGQIWNEDKTNALYGMKQLERLLAAYNIRHNPIVHWLLCGICLYDVHLARYAAAWERNYGKRVQESVDALAELEMLNSLAVLAGMRSVCYPVLCPDRQEPYINMQKGCHPLLEPEQAVPNSIRLDAGPRVITGSNMSGKTTFLRTIGMNAILAYAGAPVCAEAMEISVMRPFTSMRITDDVNQGISTFYAEILRIKEMAEYSSKEQPMLCLIDEIFKGTNSADRIVGAEAVIQKLTKSHIICIISTHDFELCRLADNYHFEETYDNGEIQFDYRLREGMCKTTNALHLLKLAGLAEEETENLL